MYALLVYFSKSSKIAVILQILALITLIAAASNSTCYYPSGKEYKGKACYPNAEVSVCCGPTFVCLSNGLCSPGPDTRKAYAFKYYRSGCTDPSWNSTSCPLFCITPRYGFDAGVPLQSCENSKFCCQETYDCCTNATNIFDLGVGNVVTTIPELSGATATARSKAQDSRPVAIGVGVGVSIGLLSIIILAVFVFLRRRNRKQRAAESSAKAELEVKEALPTYPSASGNLLELNAEQDPQELPHQPVYELGCPSPTKPGGEQLRVQSG